MGYNIISISEKDTFDFSLCSGLSTYETVPKSVDNQYFLVEGITFADYTHEEILVVLDGANWKFNDPTE